MKYAKTESVVARFRRHLLLTDGGCLEWQGKRTPAGYGLFHIGSRSDGTRRTVLAHRMAWRIAKGPIPKGLKVRHVKCHNPPCCNVDHHALGSHQDNMDDVRRDGTRKGEKNANSRLSDAAVDSIRRLYRRFSTAGMTQKTLAKRFGVTQSTVSKAVRKDRG